MNPPGQTQLAKDCGEGGGLNGVGKQSSLLSDGKENNSKGQGF